jgi:hypothetical protein
MMGKKVFLKHADDTTVMVDWDAVKHAGRHSDMNDKTYLGMGDTGEELVVMGSLEEVCALAGEPVVQPTPDAVEPTLSGFLDKLATAKLTAAKLGLTPHDVAISEARLAYGMDANRIGYEWDMVASILIMTGRDKEWTN